MTKTEQKAINTIALDNFEHAMHQLNNTSDAWHKQLRTCTATVYATNDWYILKSYDTFVACINRNSGESYDVLRAVFGYTSISAQHISKFFHDYCAIRSLSYRYYSI